MYFSTARHARYVKSRPSPNKDRYAKSQWAEPAASGGQPKQRTEEHGPSDRCWGKPRSRLNALKHGLTAENVMLPDAASCELFHDAILEELAPVGGLDGEL